VGQGKRTLDICCITLDWNSEILQKWKPLLAYLPVETVIRDWQEDYYRVLAETDERANATHFVEFMLKTLHDAISEPIATDQVGDHVTDPAAFLI